MKKIILATILIAVGVQLMARQYPDSVRQADAEQARIYKGLSFELGGGLGASRIDFQHWGQKGNNAFQSNGLSNKISFPSGNATFGMTYYFVPSFGLGTGLEFSSYSSKTTFTQPWTINGTDKYGDAYVQTLTTNATEQENIYMLEIPIGLHFRAMGEGKRVGFIGALGVKFGLPMLSNYKQPNAAQLTNTVYYPIYDLLIHDIPTVIENGAVQPYSGSFGTLVNKDNSRTMALFNYAGFAQAGILFQLSQRVDMSVSAFATYYINDVLAKHGNEAISFGSALPVGEYPTVLSNERQEQGLMNSNAVSSVHPWNVGLKIGFHFNTGKTEAQRAYDKQMREERRAARLAAEQARLEEEAAERRRLDSLQAIQDSLLALTPELESEPEPIIVPVRECDCIDTVYIVVHDTVYVRDMVEPAPVVVPVTNAVDLINEVMEKSIIWFDLDSDKPILEPKDILINIAAILKAHPQQKVFINGHACKLGKPAYNMNLALRRANAVANQLIALGVAKEQFIVQTKGANEPFRFNGNHTLEKDRRVEIIPVEITEEPSVAAPVEKAEAKPQPVNETKPQPTTEKRTVVIKAGDRLSKFARQYYGNTDDWQIIYKANRDVISNPDVLPVGKTIVIP